MLVLSSNNDCPCKNDCLGIFKSSTYTKPNRTHNITQLTSCVHGPRNKFGDKAYLQMLDSQCYRLRVTSHIRLKAHDHCNVRAHIGQKGRDRPISLHTRRWSPKGPKKTSWMKSLHEVLHGRLWIGFMVSRNFHQAYLQEVASHKFR